MIYALEMIGYTRTAAALLSMLLVAMHVFWIIILVQLRVFGRKLTLAVAFFVANIINLTSLFLRHNSLSLLVDRMKFYSLSESRIELISDLLVIVTFVLSCYFMYMDTKTTSVIITRKSILTALDHIRSGICFYDANGLLILSNGVMNNLCWKLTGRGLMNGRAFSEQVFSDYEMPGARRVKRGDFMAFVLDDETVWSFREKTIMAGGEMLYQLTATDDTSVYKISQELRATNEVLTDMGQRMREFNHQLTDLTRDEEILAAKVQIHDDIGRVLLASRRYLDTFEENADTEEEKQAFEAISDMWRRNIALLRREARPEPQTNAMEHLIAAGKAIGLNVVIDGKLPEVNLYAMRFVMAAVRESMTNAVKHGEATELYIKLDYSGDMCIRITDNGKGFTGPVAEGGGLSGLRQTVESAMGTMQINTGEHFELIIHMPI